LLGIHDILIHDKCGALGIVGDALTNLPAQVMTLSGGGSSLRWGRQTLLTG
jgi:hypothetical protein